MKVYLASPLGFSEAGRFFLYNRLVPLLEEKGIELLDPWKLTDPRIMDEALAIENPRTRIDKLKEVNLLIGSNNEEAIRSCDIMVAVLDGTDVDSGTASEIGCASALGKPVIGYREDFRCAGDNEGSAVNLQVEYFIKKQGVMVNSLEQLVKEMDLMTSGAQA